MRVLLLSLLVLFSASAWTCNSFGPDFDPTPCPETAIDPELSPGVRIPLTDFLSPIDLGDDSHGVSRGLAIVSGVVVDDFAVLFAVLPNGRKLIGTSAQCVLPLCGQLGQWARADLERQIDLLLRVTY